MDDDLLTGIKIMGSIYGAVAAGMLCAWGCVICYASECGKSCFDKCSRFFRPQEREISEEGGEEEIIIEIHSGDEQQDLINKQNR